MGRQQQGMDRPGVRKVPEGSVEQGKMEGNGCKIICGAPKTLAVKRLMMIMSLCIRGAGNFLPDFAVRDAIKFSGIQDCEPSAGPQHVPMFHQSGIWARACFVLFLL